MTSMCENFRQEVWRNKFFNLPISRNWRRHPTCQQIVSTTVNRKCTGLCHYVISVRKTSVVGRDKRELKVMKSFKYKFFSDRCWSTTWRNKRELTNRRLSHDGAVRSPYSPASSPCGNLNLRFAVKTTMFMRDRQIFPLSLKFVFIIWRGELFKLKCLTSEKRKFVSHTLMEATL